MVTTAPDARVTWTSPVVPSTAWPSTALTLTALSYTGYVSLGALLGRMAYGAVMNKWFRRVMALCFIIYGVMLGLANGPDMRRV